MKTKIIEGASPDGLYLKAAVGPGALFQMGNSPMEASWQLKKLPVRF